MKIPTGNFGNVIARPEQQVQVAASDGIGQALGGIGQKLGAISQDLHHADMERQRAQAGATLATLNNSLHDVHDEIGRSVTDGQLAPDQAIPEFKRRMGEAVTASVKDLTPEQQQLINAQVIKAGGTLERNLNGIAINRTRADTGANLLQMGAQFERSAMRDLPSAINQWASAVDTMGPQAGWGPEKIAAEKQRFNEVATYNLANFTLEGAAQSGDLNLVRAAREKIEGPDGEIIDPARRTALITKGYGFENGIIASGVREQERLKREAEARETKGRDALNDAQNLVLNGRYLSSDYIAQLSTITTGTSAAPAVRELVKSQSQVAGFASLPLPQQTAILEQRIAAGSTPGAGTSPEQEAVTTQMQKIRDGGQRDYDNNPWTAAQERGVIQRAPAANLADVPSAMSLLQTRMQQIGSVEAAAGRKVSPLQPQEAEQIGRIITALPPDQQSSALAGISTAIGNPDRLTALARQIDAKDRVLGTAMVVGDLTTTQGRYVSELVLKGARALKDKSIMVDEKREIGWRGAIAKEVADAFPSQEVRDRVIDAAYYVQAGFTAEGGGADTARAIRLVAGRIVEHNGGKIPLPRGMEEGDFNQRLKQVTPGAIAAQAPGGQVFVGRAAVSVDEFVRTLPNATLVSAGAGRYNVRAGMGLVTNSKGDRITVEVK